MAFKTVFIETGGKGDKVSGMVSDSTYASGAKGIGYEFEPWSEYDMPKPTCDDDDFSAAGFVNAQQKCGSTGAGGRRWGQCDQWRSSCDKKFSGWFADSELLVEAVVQASGVKPGEEGHVSPCIFGEMYAAAQASINLRVGSVDPVWGIGFPGPGEPGYVPRFMSYLFGGSPGASAYPDYSEPYPSDGGTYFTSKAYEGITPAYRVHISNGSFCRQVMSKTYPCLGADAYPGACGGCKDDSLFGCSDYLCTHKPLEYWDRAYNGLRVELIGAVSVYEQTNADLLNGQTIDGFCAEKVAQQVVDAPLVTMTGLSPAELAYQKEVAEEKAALAAKAEEQAMLDALLTEENLQLGGVGAGAPGLGTVALVGGLGLAAFFIYKRMKR